MCQTGSQGVKGGSLGDDGDQVSTITLRMLEFCNLKNVRQVKSFVSLCVLLSLFQTPNPTSTQKDVSTIIHRVVKKMIMLTWWCLALSFIFRWEGAHNGIHLSKKVANLNQRWTFLLISKLNIFSSEANRNPKQTRLERTKNLFTISFQVFSGWDQGWILAYLVQPAKISSQSHIWGLA